MKATNPEEQCLAQGAKYCVQIERGGTGRSGTVWDDQGAVRWRYTVRNNPSHRGRRNPFQKPDFVVTDTGNQTEVSIARASFIPSVFEISDGPKVSGRISMRSLLRNKYAIDIEGLNSWIFQMPLFTIRFHGDSRAGTDIWVVVGPSKMEWNILLRPEINDSKLVASLAFIHSEWWNYS